MNTALTDEMVSDMDSTSDFMHTLPPPFPTLASATGIPVLRTPTQYRTKGLVTAYSRGISVTGREQGQAESIRRAALCKAGI